jgi:hypothetical protein
VRRRAGGGLASRGVSAVAMAGDTGGRVAGVAGMWYGRSHALGSTRGGRGVGARQRDRMGQEPSGGGVSNDALDRKRDRGVTCRVLARHPPGWGVTSPDLAGCVMVSEADVESTVRNV